MEDKMEYGSIEREIYIEATPEVVYEVVSTPEHLRQWWPDEAEFEPVPGATGVISFGDTSTPDGHVVALTVVAADPPQRFSFRWVYDDETATPSNSLLVTFELVPVGTGTLLRLTETGFREKVWEPAVAREEYDEHVTGWNYFLPRLVTYVALLVSTP
jgi:uncharacterized protein YndB with AHSA1/START domain